MEMIAESPMRHQSAAASAASIRICSQCSTELGSFHPLSSNVCLRCSMCWKDSSHLVAPANTIGSGGKDDHKLRLIIPELYIPDFWQPRMPSYTAENTGPNGPPHLSSQTTGTSDPDGSLLEDPQLRYPTIDLPLEAPPIRLSGALNHRSPTASIGEAPPALLNNVLQPIRPPIDIPRISQLRARAPSPEVYTPLKFKFNHHTGPPSLWASQPLKLQAKLTTVAVPQRASDNIRVCASRGCVGLIVPSSTCRRCPECINADWKARKARGLSLPVRPRFTPVSILRTHVSEKGKRKTVSWADQRNVWISRIKRVRLKLPEPPPSSSTADSGHSKDEGVHSRSRQREEIPSPASDDHPYENPAVFHEVLEPYHETLVNSLLGDSDLSDLTETSSEDLDSESGGSGSESNTSEVSNGFDAEQSTSKLTIRIPPRRHLYAILSTSELASPHPRNQDAEIIPYARCSNKLECARFLPPNRGDSFCSWCRIRQIRREEQKVEYEDPEAGVGAVVRSYKASPITDIVNHELLSGDVVTGARLCTPCQYIIPPPNEYVFDHCYSCRIKARQRNAQSAQPDTKETPDGVLDELNVVAKPRPGRCRSRDCGVVVHGSSECWQCVSRRMENRAKEGTTRGDAGVSISAKASGISSQGFSRTPSCSEQSTNRLLALFTPYPEYRCQHELLADFHTRFSAFLEIQNIHSLYKPPWNPEMSDFGFDGQFSVVALDRDLLVRKDAVELDVLKLKRELERLGTLQFEPDKAVTINDSGIFTRFLCVHRLYNPFGAPYPDQEPKLMQGELEIAALPDHSHYLLAGQKTVVRFRLVG